MFTTSSSPRHATQVIRVTLECNEKLLLCIRLLDQSMFHIIMKNWCVWKLCPIKKIKELRRCMKRKVTIKMSAFIITFP